MKKKISFKRVTEFPWDAKLGEIATREISENPQAVELVMSRSTSWLISIDGTPIMLMGLIKLSLVGGATRAWIVTFEDFNCYKVTMYKFLKRVVKVLRRCVGHISVTIDDNLKESRALASKLGFVRSNERIMAYNTTYVFYYMR